MISDHTRNVVVTAFRKNFAHTEPHLGLEGLILDPVHVVENNNGIFKFLQEKGHG